MANSVVNLFIFSIIAAPMIDRLQPASKAAMLDVVLEMIMLE